MGKKNPAARGRIIRASCSHWVPCNPTSYLQSLSDCWGKTSTREEVAVLTTVQCTVYHNREVEAAGDWSSWSHIICDQETGKCRLLLRSFSPFCLSWDSPTQGMVSSIIKMVFLYQSCLSSWYRVDKNQHHMDRIASYLILWGYLVLWPLKNNFLILKRQ